MNERVREVLEKRGENSQIIEFIINGFVSEFTEISLSLSLDLSLFVPFIVITFNSQNEI